MYVPYFNVCCLPEFNCVGKESKQKLRYKFNIAKLDLLED